jgi:hypothetical protein
MDQVLDPGPGFGHAELQQQPTVDHRASQHKLDYDRMRE